MTLRTNELGEKPLIIESTIIGLLLGLIYCPILIKLVSGWWLMSIWTGFISYGIPFSKSVLMGP